MQCGSGIPCEDFPPYMLLNFSPEVAHCPLAQHHIQLGSKGFWRVQAHLPQGTELSLWPAALAAGDQ